MSKIRHPKSGRPILNAPLCVDDFGSLVYRCHYTSATVATGEAIFIGPCTPQVNGTYVCAPDALPAFRASKRAFDEADANCNSCANLERVPHVKTVDGLMRGRCSVRPQPFSFHPDDYMGMPCWTERNPINQRTAP